MLGLSLWFGLSVVVSMIAAATGRGGVNWFVISVLLTPPLAAVLLFATAERESGEQPESANGKRSALTELVPPVK